MRSSRLGNCNRTVRSVQTQLIASFRYELSRLCSTTVTVVSLCRPPGDVSRPIGIIDVGPRSESATVLRGSVAVKKADETGGRNNEPRCSIALRLPVDDEAATWARCSRPQSYPNIAQTLEHRDTAIGPSMTRSSAAVFAAPEMMRSSHGESASLPVGVRASRPVRRRPIMAHVLVSVWQPGLVRRWNDSMNCNRTDPFNGGRTGERVKTRTGQLID